METLSNKQAKVVIWLTSLVLFFPFFCQAEIYKWVDENGRTHYGDKPQKEDAEKVELKKQRRTEQDSSARQRKQQRLLDIYEEERKERKEKKALKVAEEKKRKSNCLKAKKELTEVKNSSFLYEETDDPFNPRVLSDEERNRAIAKAQFQMKHWCKK